jgi:NADH-quinone oxidoreductase subunit H
VTSPLLFADLPASVPGWVPDVFTSLIKIFVLVNVILGLVSYTVMAERRISAAIQDRIGPNRVGVPLGGVNILGLFTMPKWTWWGLGQPLADALKFMLKEEFTPAGVNQLYFWLAPSLAMLPALFTICVIPFGSTAPITFPWGYTMKSPGVIADLSIGVLLVFALASLSVYGIVLAGWASNSKYPFLAALRSAAQMVSYEVSIGFVIITVLLCVGSLNLTAIVEAQNSAWGFLGWYWLPLFPMLVVFFVSALAETNRPPFDLVEAESELVAGFMVEYGSTPYMMFMLGEYVAVTTMCAMCTILFLGGWLPLFPVAPFTWIPGVIWFVAKASFVFFMFAMVKAFVPRYRYDQLMRLGWKVFLPISLGMVAIVAGVLQITGWAPK